MKITSLPCVYVSILVVLDVVLEAMVAELFGVNNLSFNPCCAGCSSGSSRKRRVLGV